MPIHDASAGHFTTIPATRFATPHTRLAQRS